MEKRRGEEHDVLLFRGCCIAVVSGVMRHCTKRNGSRPDWPVIYLSQILCEFLATVTIIKCDNDAAPEQEDQTLNACYLGCLR